MKNRDAEKCLYCPYWSYCTKDLCIDDIDPPDEFDLEELLDE